MKSKTNIILAGVGGQGILSIATVIGAAAMREGLYIKQSEVHGMSQRGGDVQAHLRLSPRPIASDLIPVKTADIIIALEPMEALRYSPYLTPEGHIITAAQPFININNYTPVEEILAQLQKNPRCTIVNAEQIAQQLGNTRVANMVLLGAVLPFVDISWEHIAQGVNDVFLSKGDAIVKANIAALTAGREITK